MGQQKNQGLNQCCSLIIKAMILKTVLFYFQYIQLGSVIYQTKTEPFFPSNGKLSAKPPLEDLQKGVKTTRDFPLFSALTVMIFGSIP